LLDANAWIALFRQSSPLLLAHLQMHAASDVALCSVVLGELWYGVHRSGSTNRARNEALVDQLCARYVSLPFDDAAAKEYARIRAYLATAGRIIGGNDMLIAAIAAANGLILITHNTAEFNRVPGLVIEDWEVS
jgi:tRNA(fMet)-specific endonuclease VapC